MTPSQSVEMLRPVDAATLVLVDERGKKPKVLMGQRNANLRFMPGKFVFPGGRVDAADRAMLASGAVSPRQERQLTASASRMTPQRCRALAMAAIRETFEETGLMIGTGEFGAPEKAPAGTWREFADQGLFPTLDSVYFVARAITPPRRIRRFDTRFFAASLSAVGGKVERIIGQEAELTELVWVTLDEAIKLDLPMITQVILHDIRERLMAGLEAPGPVPFYRERHGQFIREIL